MKDNVASAESIKLVSEHLKSCEKCRLEFENYTLVMKTEFNEEKVVSLIKKKLFVSTSLLILIGTFIGMALNKNSSSTFMPAIVIVLDIIFVGVLVFKFDLKGDERMKRFFIGKAIGTIIVFAILGIYLLLKYGLHLF